MAAKSCLTKNGRVTYGPTNGHVANRLKTNADEEEEEYEEEEEEEEEEDGESDAVVDDAESSRKCEEAEGSAAPQTTQATNSSDPVEIDREEQEDKDTEVEEEDVEERVFILFLGGHLGAARARAMANED